MNMHTISILKQLRGKKLTDDQEISNSRWIVQGYLFFI